MRRVISILAFGMAAAALSACVTSDGIKRDGYRGEFDGKSRYTFQLVKNAWGYRVSQNFEAAVRRLGTETCGGPYREVSRKAGKAATSYPIALGPAQKHTEMHIVIECVG